MKRSNSLSQWYRQLLIVFTAIIILPLAGCEGDAGTPGADGQTGLTGPSIAPLAGSTELNFEITGVTINSAPVVSFKVTNQDGVAVAGFADSDLRFNIAKLMPGSPARWQNYINHEKDGLTHGYQERASTGGSLVDNLNGSFVYTFATDITDPAQTCPTAPCNDADGNTLDLSYQASLTHRVSMQQGNRALPLANVAYDFVPDGSAVTTTRDIVKTETCNQCHNQLAMHGGGRIEVKLCVTCHNPGTTRQGKVGTVDEDLTVDFGPMIHKLHMGEDLPSVAAGGDYAINGYRGSAVSFKDVVFPQSINNCTKCHDGTPGAANETAEGDNWKTVMSKAVCSSCHDDVYFGAASATSYQTTSHVTKSGITDPDDSTCTSCHGPGTAKDVAVMHAVPVNLAATKFQYNILEICGTAVDTGSPSCAVASAPTVKFSVSDPTGATTHGYGNLYDVVGTLPGTDPVTDRDPEFGTSASLNVLTAWDSSDYSNAGGAGSRPARASSLAAISNAVDNNDGTFTITLAALPATVTGGSGAVAIEGHPRGQSDLSTTTFDISVPVKGAVAYFGIGADPAVTRRVAVDVETKCDQCHNQLSLHGNNRADNAQLCVMCHNPRNTDIGRRDTVTNGVPEIGLDGKREETVDMKVMIHAIHAGAKSGHGVRENGIVLYGYGNNAHEYGHVRFPGILTSCTACHNSGTYELDGKWAAPLQNGILATTVQSAPDDSVLTKAAYDVQMADQTDDLMTTPTAAVCSACHDSKLAEVHMETIGGAKFLANKAAIDTSYETCSVCHGPGKAADVAVVHGVK